MSVFLNLIKHGYFLKQNRQRLMWCVLRAAGVQCNPEPGLYADRGLLRGYVTAPNVFTYWQINCNQCRCFELKYAKILILRRSEGIVVPEVSRNEGLGRSVSSNWETSEREASAQAGWPGGKGTNSSCFDSKNCSKHQCVTKTWCWKQLHLEKPLQIWLKGFDSC